MAKKVYDISSKLTNENPRIKLDKEHEYEVNTDKNVVFQMTEMQQKGASDEEILVLLLGKENAKEVDEYLASKPNYAANLATVMICAVAAVSNIPYEVAEQRFRNAIQG